MTQPTPLDAAPAVQRRQLLVADAMAGLDDLDELSVPDQFARLQEAATVLSGVLQNSGDLSQLGIPGVAARP